MPVNKVEDRIYDFCKLDNSFHCQILPAVVDSEWPVLVNGDRVWEQQNVGEPWNFDAGNYNVLEGGQLISRPEFLETTSLNNQLNTYGFMFGWKNYEAEKNHTNFWDETSSYDPHSFTLKNFSLLKLHQEYASVDSPTLTANSERSEITETSTDLHYLGGPQQFVGGQQQHNISLPRSMHQPGFNDMQYLPQHVLLKQLQELHGQQQIQQLGDARQQSSLNQFYAVPKQGTCPQDSALLDGIPVDDPSQIFINRTQRETFSNAEGLSNRFIFSQDQGQTFFPASLVSQQLDGALYGTPTSSRRGTMSLNSELQGMGHAQKSTVPMALSKPLLHGNVSINQDAFFPEGSSFKQGFQGKNVFERGVQGLEREVTLGNFQLGGNQTNTLFPDVLGGQDVASWPEMLEQKKAPPGPSLDSVPLDPIEERILYNMEDNSWDASFGRHNEDGAGGFGSWSALMQSAVAEASNIDTGIQEWTFQNTELSTDNHPTNSVDREKLRPDWIENNLLGPSSLRPDSVMGYRFSQQPRIQLQQREHLYQENSHESTQKSFINTGEWLECNSHLKPLNVRSQQVHPIEDLNSPWAGQIHEQSESDARTFQRQRSSYNNVSQPCSKERGVYEGAFNRSEAEGFIWKIDGDSQQLDYMRHAGLSMDEETETGRSNHNEMSNGSIALQNSYDFAGETFLEGKYQREKSYDAHLSSISSQQGRHVQQSKYFDDFSSNAMKLDKEFLTGSQRNTRALDEIATEGDQGASTNFSFGHNGENLSAKISHNMLELLPKVDQSKDNSSVPHYHSPRSMPRPMITEEGVDDTLLAEPLNLLSTSQGCTLGLGPSFQRQSTPNRIHSAYMPLSTSGSQNVGLGDKNQTLVSFPFGAHVLASNESSQNAYWDDKSNLRRQTGNASSLLMQGNSAAGLTHPQYGRNRPPMQVISKAASSHSSAQASFPGMGFQSPVSNFASSQEISHQPSNDNSSEQFPVLEAQPVFQTFRPGMDQCGELSARQQNAWKNKLKMEANMASPFGQASNDVETTVSVSKGLNSQISQEGESERKIISANFEDTSHIGEMVSKISNSKGTPSFSLLASPQQRDLGDHSENKIATASETNDVRQIATMSQEKAGVNQKNIRLVASSLLSSDLSNFIRSTGENPEVLSSLQPPQEKLSGGSATFGQIESQTQYGSSNLALDRAENAQHNPHLAPSWFKQYGAFRNGQMPMPSIYNPLHAKAAVGHLPLANPSVDLQKQSSLGRVDSAQESQSDPILHSAAAVLTVNDPFTTAPFFTADVSGQNMAISRPKKRKCAAYDLRPWNEEVKQGSQRILSISMVEQAWAESTNRLMEKVGDEFEMAEDGLSMYPSKRRLILTTQLMQQLLLPAPAVVFSAKVSSVYDSVTYFVARLSLGDACSLTCRSRKDDENSLNDDDSNSENLKAVKTTGAQYYANTVENFSTRAQKLENDLLRLDKALSIINLRVECHELERFSVINRFAKFHIRQADGASSSGFSANAPKTCPQRYVTANPMPRNLPDGMQCISL